MSALRPLLRPVFSTRAFSTTRPASLARMQLIGRLAAEPELQATSTGKDVLRYAVGTTHQTKDGPQTSWFRVASFDEGPRRDFVAGLPKGTLVYVEGDARMSTYEDAERGRQTRLDLVQRNIEVLSRPRAALDAASAASNSGSASSDEGLAASG